MIHRKYRRKRTHTYRYRGKQKVEKESELDDVTALFNFLTILRVYTYVY